MRVKFDDLPRGVRERLVALSRTPTDPHVIVASPGGAGGWFKYLTLLAGGFICFATLQFLFERSRNGIHPYYDREIFFMLAGGVFLVAASLASFVFLKLFPLPPYRTGAWALRSYLMRLSRGRVELVPLTELGRPTVVTRLRNGYYQGSRLDLVGDFSFYFASKEAVDQACARVLAARDVFASAVAAKDARTLAEVDVFSECTLSGQWASASGLEGAEGPRAPVVPGSARLVQWVGSLALGAGSAGAAYLMFLAKGGALP